MSGRIITFQLALHDETGILSSLLTIFAQWGANILTINQTIPTNGCAAVTISAETNHLQISLEELFALLEFHAGRRPCGYFSRLTGSGNRFISSPSHRLGLGPEADFCMGNSVDFLTEKRSRKSDAA